MSGIRAAAILALARRYYLRRTALAGGAALVVVVATADVLCPWMMMEAIDVLVSGAGPVVVRFGAVVIDAAVIGVLISLQFVAHYFLVRLQSRTVFAGSSRLRFDLYAAIQEQALRPSAERRLGEALGRFLTDVQQLQEALLELLADLPFDVLILVGMTAVMVWVAPALGLIVLAFLALVVLVSAMLGRQGWRGQAEALERAGAVSARVGEHAGAARTLAVLGAAGSERADFELALREHETAQASTSQVGAVVGPFFGFSEYVGLVMVLLVGGWFLLQGRLSVGGLVAFLAYMEMAAEPIGRCGRILPRLQKASAAADRLLGWLRPRQSASAGTAIIADPAGAIIFDDVTFRYPGAERAALRSLSFEVRPRERIAIIGRNGAGKSTLLDLLVGLEAPSSGVIRIDGVDLRELSPEQHRRTVAVVPQEILLLNRTILENIALGADGSAPTRAAATAAGLDPFAAALPSGYATMVGERGATLSGGQRQRVAIARAFARAPTVVVLDEPTAALDAMSEGELLPALMQLCAGRTSLIVSHRPRLLESADKVLLLLDGEQIDFATPDEAWQRHPDWRDLFPSAWASGPASVNPPTPAEVPS